MWCLSDRTIAPLGVCLDGLVPSTVRIGVAGEADLFASIPEMVKKDERLET